jgi:hypothetical protein
MKKPLLAALVILVAAVVIGACFFAKNQHRSSFQWETRPRAVLEAFPQAHDPKISIAMSGDILLLATGKDPHGAPLQLFISHDGGDTFAPGVPVSGKDSKLDSHGENSPVIVNGMRGPAVLWDQPGASGSQIMCAHSMDDGASFSRPVKVNDAANASAYAGHLVADGKVLFAAWLDGRDHAHNGTSSIYFARSTNGGATWPRNVRVTKNACPCCRPNLAVLPNGHVVAIWRNVFPGQIRDMACAVSTDGGQTWSAPRRVAVDNWHIMGCPVSGPHLVAVGKRLFAAWYSEGTGQNPGVRLSWSDDEGATWNKPMIASLPLQDTRQPYLYADSGGHVYLAFRARDPKRGDGWSQLRTYIVTVHTDGQVSSPVLAPGQNSVAYPVLAADKTGRLWVAWNGDHTVQLLRGRKRADSSSIF